MNTTKSIDTRFWEKVDCNGPIHSELKSRCWIWIGCIHNRKTDKRGYFNFHGKTISVHRAAYQLAFGSIPNGLHVLHRCDNPICVNPLHLMLGTHQLNMQDRNQKGRARGGKSYGEKHPGVKLTDKNIIEIRTQYGKGDISQRELARIYGVSQGHISEIINRKCRVQP